MKTILSAILLAVVSGFSQTVNFLPLAWQLTSDSAVQQPQREADGSIGFDMPDANVTPGLDDGYLTCVIAAKKSTPFHLSGTLVVTVEVVALQTTTFECFDYPACRPPTFRLLIETFDSWSKPTSRWWSFPGESFPDTGFVLTNGVHTFSIPISPDQWYCYGGTMGSENPTAFFASMNNVKAIGGTWGHLGVLHLRSRCSFVWLCPVSNSRLPC